MAGTTVRMPLQPWQSHRSADVQRRRRFPLPEWSVSLCGDGHPDRQTYLPWTHLGTGKKSRDSSNEQRVCMCLPDSLQSRDFNTDSTAADPVVSVSGSTLRQSTFGEIATNDAESRPSSQR